MTKTSGLEYARHVFDFYGEEVGQSLLPSCYKSDTPRARITRVILAIITGPFKVLFFPIACAGGLLFLPLYGLKRVFFNEEKKIEAKQFDSPCVGAIFCAGGLILTLSCLGLAAYGYLSFNQMVNLLLSMIALGITANVVMALRNHAKAPLIPENPTEIIRV